MKTSNELKVGLIALLLTSGLIGSVLYVVFNHPSAKNLVSLLTGSSTPAPSPIQPSPIQDVSTRISAGETLLIPADSNPAKQSGITAISSGDVQGAIAALETALKTNRNDPEAVIYLNNAKINEVESFTIAVSIPIGSNLNVAKEILRGVAQAQTEINQTGGISRVPLRVIIANDDNQPAIVKLIAEHMVKDPNVLAVVGHNSSNASLAGAAIYQAGGLAMISPTTTARELSGFGSYIYQMAVGAPFQASSLAVYAKTHQRTRMGICYSSSAEAAISLKQEFTVAATATYGDATVISRVDCDLSSSTFNPAQMISSMVSNGVDTLLLSPSIDEIERAMLIARGSRGKFLLLSDSTLYTIKTLEMGQADVLDMVLTVPWHPQAIPKHSFPTKAAKLWSGHVNWRTATAYDAVQTIAAGLRQTPTRSGLQQALSSPDFSADGATGKIQFQPSGDRVTTPLFVTIQPSSGSSSGYAFVPKPANP